MNKKNGKKKSMQFTKSIAYSDIQRHESNIFFSLEMRGRVEPNDIGNMNFSYARTHFTFAIFAFEWKPIQITFSYSNI